MKAQEFRGKSQSELETLVKTKFEELASLYADLRTKDVKNTHSFRVLKKDIARIKTVMGEPTKQLQESK
jgi:ribosomal protein L29